MSPSCLARTGADACLLLQFEDLDNLEEDIVRVADEFQAGTKRPLLYALVFV